MQKNMRDPERKDVVMPLISVIVPVYKVEPYLHRCVDSILAQTFRDFELILVDDGSPDRCPAICEEYAAEDSRIHVIHQQNGGLSAARNAGMRHATGEYFVFIDSDDAVKNCLLAKVVPYLSQYDMVSYEFTSLFEDGRIEECSAPKAVEYHFPFIQDKLSFIVNTLLPYKMGWEACLKVFRKSVIEKYHLQFEDNRKIFAEDMYFTLCYCSHIGNVYRMNESLYLYYRRSDSIMGENTGACNVGRFALLSEAFYHHLAKEGPADLLPYFPVIHFRIIYHAFLHFQDYHHPKDFPKTIQNEVKNMEFCKSQFHKARKQLKYLEGPLGNRLILSNLLSYWINDDFLLFRIRNKLNIYIMKILRVFATEHTTLFF